MLKRSPMASLGVVYLAGALFCLGGTALAEQNPAREGNAVGAVTPDKEEAKVNAPEDLPAQHGNSPPASASKESGAKAAAARGMRGAGPPDYPKWYHGSSEEIATASVIEGRKAGIEVGDYAPDFELQPVQPSADLEKWLGVDAPQSIERNVMLSKLVGKAPVMLFFGSYT